jgi:hypothetical protein
LPRPAQVREAREPSRRYARVARLLAWLTVLVPLLIVVSPWLADATTYGIRDWDFEISQRYLTKLSLLTYGQLPFWNPYACGGFPAWGYVEGATTLVSPWLVPYLVLPMTAALRVEVIGSGLLGAVGAFALAGCFTRSYAGRALVVALWAVDSRWALQAGAGHTWHLLYAWMPWCFYFFERTTAPSAGWKPTVALAVCLALLVYGGGIYPLPHVVLALSLYAVVLAITLRSFRPVRRLLVPGMLGAALAAPKLLPMLHEFAKHPRTIDSIETTSAEVLWRALTSREQSLLAQAHLDYGWHEYGIYVGVAGVIALVLAVGFVWGPRETALKAVAVTFVVLGCGSFHRDAPWAILHAHAPFFRSEHVPSRFLYPAVMLLALVLASGVGRAVRGRAWLDALLTAVALALALDVAIVARRSMTETMVLTAPPIAPPDAFHHDQVSPYRYRPFSVPQTSYFSMVANRGVIGCYGLPEIGTIGALGVKDPRFQGEATVALPGGMPLPAALDGAGATARVDAWSPNQVVIALHDVPAGSTVIYNMNYDDGWRSDEGDAIDVDGRVGARLSRERGAVTFTYRPPFLVLGLFIGALGILAALAAARWVGEPAL